MIWDWILDNVIALLALGISFWAAWYSRKYDKEQTEIQRRVVELEEQREEEKKRFRESADIEAKIDFEEAGGYRFPRKILVCNHGPADAENIEVLVNGRPPSNTEYLITETRNDTIEVLPADDHYDYLFGNRKENQAPVEIIVMYDDPLNEKKEYKTKLRL